MFSCFFLEILKWKKKLHVLVYFNHQNVNSLCLCHHYQYINTPVAHTSSVILLSYENMILDQLVAVYFLNALFSKML